MKRLGDMMQRDPTDAEREVMAHVIGLAQAWQSGALGLDSVRQQSTGYERWQAMRFANLGSAGKVALMALVDALVDQDETGFTSGNGWVTRDELHSGNVKQRTNHAGKRVLVWPMHEIEGVPVYPHVEMEPGEKRREREMAALQAYTEYRRKKGRLG